VRLDFAQPTGCLPRFLDLGLSGYRRLRFQALYGFSDDGTPGQGHFPLLPETSRTR
jgi:hypothetical protein